MIQTEIIEVGSRQLKKTYTDDETKMLHKVGTDEFYGEAIDIIDSPYEYEEVDKPQEEEDETQEETKK